MSQQHSDLQLLRKAGSAAGGAARKKANHPADLFAPNWVKKTPSTTTPNSRNGSTRKTPIAQQPQPEPHRHLPRARAHKVARSVSVAHPLDHLCSNDHHPYHN